MILKARETLRAAAGFSWAWLPWLVAPLLVATATATISVEAAELVLAPGLAIAGYGAVLAATGGRRPRRWLLRRHRDVAARYASLMRADGTVQLARIDFGKDLGKSTLTFVATGARANGSGGLTLSGLFRVDDAQSTMFDEGSIDRHGALEVSFGTHKSRFRAGGASLFDDERWLRIEGRGDRRDKHDGRRPGRQIGSATQ